MKTLQYCCSIFDWYVMDAGTKGITAFPVEIDGAYHFILQARSNDPDAQEKIYHLESVIHFCPSCGCNLDEFIEKHKDAVIELAEKHKRLLE